MDENTCEQCDTRSEDVELYPSLAVTEGVYLCPTCFNLNRTRP